MNMRNRLFEFVHMPTARAPRGGQHPQAMLGRVRPPPKCRRVYHGHSGLPEDIPVFLSALDQHASADRRHFVAEHQVTVAVRAIDEAQVALAAAVSPTPLSGISCPSLKARITPRRTHNFQPASPEGRGP